MKKLIRIAASPLSLDTLLCGQLRHFGTRYEVVAVASPDAALHRRIREREGVRTVPLYIERHIAPLRDLRSLVRLYLLFRRERPHIVHSLTPKAGLLSMVASRLARVPVRIHTFTGLVFPWRRGVTRHLLATADRLTCACATHIIPEGEGVKRDLETHRITRKPMQVVANGHINGIDPDHFRPARRAAGGVTRFIFTGRLVKDKGIEELKQAFEKIPEATLTLVGTFEQNLDPLTPATHRWATAGDRVTNLGWQDDIRPHLRAADVLVLPSHREGFPGTLLQAGAMGLPVIATDICGCNEIVVDGETGLLVPPRDATRLHHAMARLADDPSLRREMGLRARRRVVEKFSHERVWSALEKFYADVS